MVGAALHPKTVKQEPWGGRSGKGFVERCYKNLNTTACFLPDSRVSDKKILQATHYIFLAFYVAATVRFLTVYVYT